MTYTIDHLMKIKVLMIVTIFSVFIACNENPSTIQEGISEMEISNAESVKPSVVDEYSFDGPMFDIAALPNGGILVADFATIKEIHKNGVREITTLPLVEGSGAFGETETTFINGLKPIGNGNFFATRSGLDLSVGAALFRSTRGNARMVGDIESFTLGDWQEEGEGEPGQNPAWKNFECEPPGGFSAGPHSNPYHLTALSGSEVLIADAAGNSLLHATTNGNIEVVAYFPPVVDPDSQEQLVQFPLGDINCPVEPVPTAVAVGDDGAYYVGELNGTTAENLAGEASPEGLASIWRVEPGSRNVNCPSESCTKVLTGLTSVIDIEFGPDGYLYVVEYEKNGFFSTVVTDPDTGLPVIQPEGGAVKKCDINSDTCGENDIIYGGENGSLMMPGAITFDKWDNLWLLENVFEPTVRTIDWN